MKPLITLLLLTGLAAWPASVQGQQGELAKTHRELANEIAQFNVITQYANFELLKKQLPEEAERLGIE